MAMSQLQIDVLAKRPHHDGKGRKVQISLGVGKVDIKEDSLKLHVYGDNYDHLMCISDDSFRRQITDYSGIISIPASTVMELAAQVLEKLAQRDDSSRMKEALVPVAVTALRDVLAATSRALR
jgi:hypothetical protein